MLLFIYSVCPKHSGSFLYFRLSLSLSFTVCPSSSGFSDDLEKRLWQNSLSAEPRRRLRRGRTISRRRRRDQPTFSPFVSNPRFAYFRDAGGRPLPHPSSLCCRMRDVLFPDEMKTLQILRITPRATTADPFPSSSRISLTPSIFLFFSHFLRRRKPRQSRFVLISFLGI